MGKCLLVSSKNLPSSVLRAMHRLRKGVSSIPAEEAIVDDVLFQLLFPTLILIDICRISSRDKDKLTH